MTPLSEGVLALIAMVLVLTCTVYMMRHGKMMEQHIREHIDATDHAGSAAFTGVFLFTLLMIGREGVETVT